MWKLVPLNNRQGEERVFVVAGCSWYLDEVKRMHVSAWLSLFGCEIYSGRGTATSP